MLSNRTPSLLLALLATVILSSCRVSHFSVSSKDGFLLREIQAEDGTTTTYRLYSGGSTPKLHLTESGTTEVPSFGLRVRTLDEKAAKTFGVEAFSGVRVDWVASASPAERAGLSRGDRIVRIGDERIVSQEQLEHVVQAELEAGVPVEVEVLRAPPKDEAGADAAEVAAERLLVTPDSKRIDVSRTDVLPLDHSRLVLQLSGLQLAGLSAELAATIFDLDEPIVLVAEVLPGSPAYHSGLRRGDRVLRCDGREVRQVADVRRVVRARAAARGFEIEDLEDVSAAVVMTEEAERRAADTAATADEADERSERGPITIEVDGPLGPYSASLRITDELDEEWNFDIPILVEYETDLDSTRFSFLDFILQFGWNYRSRYVSSETRDARSSSYLSLFPFGMFEFVRTPERSETTLLWFITFESER